MELIKINYSILLECQTLSSMLIIELCLAEKKIQNIKNITLFDIITSPFDVGLQKFR